VGFDQRQARAVGLESVGVGNQIRARSQRQRPVSVEIIVGDCRDVLRRLPDRSVHCCVTSPPYFGLRDYGVAGQMGLESTPEQFVAGMVEVFREVRRVLRDDGTLWLNIGDSYAGGGNYRGINSESTLSETQRNNRGARGVSPLLRAKNTPGCKPKDLIGIPWMLAFALRADGWWLRQDIIWAKPNPMPESVRDRCTKAHEYIFLLAKSERYYYDQAAIMEPANPDNCRDSATRRRNTPPGSDTDSGFENGRNYLDRNKRSVWTVTTQPFKEAHFATFPPALVEPCIKAGCPAGGLVLDPFGGAGTTGLVADRLQRDAVLIELNPEYAAIAQRRIRGDAPLFAEIRSTDHRGETPK
jgi:DNA modification methylase